MAASRLRKPQYHVLFDGESKNVRRPFLCGFEYTRPDHSGEVSRYDMGTTSNLYRCPDYQLNSPTKTSDGRMRSIALELFSLRLGFGGGLVLSRSRSMLVAWDLQSTYFGFHVGEMYQNAVAKCLDPSLCGGGEDEDHHLRSIFSKQVAEALESCYVVG